MTTPEQHADQVLASFDPVMFPGDERQRLHTAIVEALNAYAAPRLERFDGAAAWRLIPVDERDQLGALLLEWGFATLACEAIGDAGIDVEQGVVPRAISAASVRLDVALLGAIGEYLPMVIDAEGDAVHRLPIPSMIGQVCHKCGCTDHDGCGLGCHWVRPDLCSACVEPAPAVTQIPDLEQ